MKPIHENLRAARSALKQRGRTVTLKEIAAHLQSLGHDYGTSTVGHWFTGRNKPPVDALRRLASKLQTDVGTLIEGDLTYVGDPTTRAIIERLERASQSQREAILAMLESFTDRR